jgi:hypothetical protein
MQIRSASADLHGFYDSGDALNITFAFGDANSIQRSFRNGVLAGAEASFCRVVAGKWLRGDGEVDAAGMWQLLVYSGEGVCVLNGRKENFFAENERFYLT